MSHPSINRWGLNLFWYRFWYNDKISALLNHQDVLIDKLIITYLQYGLLINKNFFFSKYWFIRQIKKNINFDYLQNTKYFRTVEYKNKVIDEYRTYKIRNKIKNLYFSKLWLFRYQNWLIVNFYCYQPLKKIQNTYNVKKKITNVFIFKKKIKLSKIARYKILFFYTLTTVLTNFNYYKF